MKKGELALILGVFLLGLFLISSVSALTASISNPRMVLYKNITRGGIDFENHVIVNNDNDYDVLIKIIPIDDWSDKIFLEASEKSFIISSGERKKVEYTIKLNSPGYYDSDLLITFLEPGTSNELSLAQNLVVIALDENGNVTEEGTNNPVWAWILVVAILVLLVIIFILNSMKRRK